MLVSALCIGNRKCLPMVRVCVDRMGLGPSFQRDLHMGWEGEEAVPGLELCFWSRQSPFTLI